MTNNQIDPSMISEDELPQFPKVIADPNVLNTISMEDLGVGNTDIENIKIPESEEFIDDDADFGVGPIAKAANAGGTTDLAELSDSDPAITSPEPVTPDDEFGERRFGKFLDRDTADMARQMEAEVRAIERSAIYRLVNAVNQKQPVECVVSSVVRENGIYYWVCFEGSASIYVPFNECFQTLDESVKANTRAAHRAQRNLLSNSIGSKVKLILTSISTLPDGSIIAYGSRLRALDLEREVYFGPNAINPVQPHMELMGSIIAIGHTALYVTACGLDIRLDIQRLTHYPIIDSLTKYPERFKVGKKIRLYVLKVIENGQDNLPVLQLSGKPIEMEYIFRPHLKRINIRNIRNNQYRAVITSVRRESSRPGSKPSVVVNLYLKGVELPAFSRTLNLSILDAIHTGDEVTFRARGATPDGYIYGAIVSIVAGRRSLL